MSTNENHNDDMFRSSIEGYREMPSERVWAGVESALDNNKKKRRFIIWWWTGGIAFSAVAALLGILFLNMPKDNAGDLLSVSNKPRIESNSPAAEKTPAKKSVVSENNSTEVSVNANSSAGQSTLKNNTFKVNKATKVPYAKSNSKSLNHPSMQTENAGYNRMDETKKVPREDAAGYDPVIASLNIGEKAKDEENIDVATDSTINTTMILGSGSENATTMPIISNLIASTSIVPQFTPILSVQGYAGGVGYHRKEKTTVPNNNTNDIYNSMVTKAKPFGFYSGVSIKGGFMFKNQLYVTAGLGYETQRFASRETFFVPGSFTGSTPLTNQSFDFLTPFGNATLPIVSEDVALAGETLEGKLVYQNHSLFFPIDIGYKFSYKRLGINLGAAAAFHVPISQNAKFYADGGDVRNVNVNKTAPFNFSIGIEPILEYRFARIASIMAGGTFRYSVLNAFQNTNNFSRPYVLSGNLGLRFYIPNK